MQGIEKLTAAGFPSAVRSGAVLVDFFATWCGPCRRQGEIMDGMARECKFPAGVKIAKLDIDEAPVIAAKFQIEVVPTLILFRDGVVAKRVSGVSEEDALLEFLS